MWMGNYNGLLQVFYAENAGYGKVLTWFFSRIFLLPLHQFLDIDKEAFDHKVSSSSQNINKLQIFQFLCCP